MQDMAKALAEHFEEEEMYRVDHYLGKPGVMAIGEYRSGTCACCDFFKPL